MSKGKRPVLNPEREREIGQRERLFDLNRQIVSHLERGLAYLQGQLNKLANASQRFAIERDQLILESRCVQAREDLAAAEQQLVEGWRWRGGIQPTVRPSMTATVEAAISADIADLVKQYETEATLQKVKDDAIPYAEKLARTTAIALDSLWRHPESTTTLEPATVPEKIAAIELKINRTKTEVANLDEALRPWRLAQVGSRITELRAQKSVEIQFAEEQFQKKTGELANLIAEHKSLLSQRSVAV
jgi:hypothetical protein